MEGEKKVKKETLYTVFDFYFSNKKLNLLQMPITDKSDGLFILRKQVMKIEDRNLTNEEEIQILNAIINNEKVVIASSNKENYEHAIKQLKRSFERLLQNNIKRYIPKNTKQKIPRLEVYDDGYGN